MEIIERIDDPDLLPYDLLELADPSRNQIDAYLASGTCYALKTPPEIVGVIVLHEVDPSTMEIRNIAVRETAQGKGFGKRLLQFAERISREQGYAKLIIGTGNSSIGQLALYQKAGFEMKRIEQDFFVKHYDVPIFENGIRCKHLVVLEMELAGEAVF